MVAQNVRMVIIPLVWNKMILEVFAGAMNMVMDGLFGHEIQKQLTLAYQAPSGKTTPRQQSSRIPANPRKDHHKNINLQPAHKEPKLTTILLASMIVRLRIFSQ